jgi:hypothetical protein
MILEALVRSCVRHPAAARLPESKNGARQQRRAPLGIGPRARVKVRAEHLPTLNPNPDPNLAVLTMPHVVVAAAAARAISARARARDAPFLKIQSCVGHCATRTGRLSCQCTAYTSRPDCIVPSID